MSNRVLEQELIEQVRRLDEEQQRRVLEFAQRLKRRKGTPGRLFLELTRDIKFHPDDLDVIERAIEEDCERIDLDDWDLPS